MEESTRGCFYVCAQEREPVARLSSGRLARRASDFLLFSRLEKERQRESNALVKFPRRRVVVVAVVTTAATS